MVGKGYQRMAVLLSKSRGLAGAAFGLRLSSSTAASSPRLAARFLKREGLRPQAVKAKRAPQAAALTAIARSLARA
jgi:hypothetical protein